jgi:ribosomal-protein-alanine N-acetyltransferase
MATDPSASGSIRRATENDLGRILEIESLSFENQWDLASFRSALEELFLVLEEKEVVGFLSACCCALARRAVIMRIAVHPDHRGGGVATRLITALLDHLREMKVSEVELDVEIVKTGAIGLYEKLGFRTRRVLPVNGEENEGFIEMTRRLCH